MRAAILDENGEIINVIEVNSLDDPLPYGASMIEAPRGKVEMGWEKSENGFKRRPELPQGAPNADINN